MKKTALTEVHKKMGAKLVPFAGFEMPVQYTGVNDEHLAVRNDVGVFDVSHMGEFLVKGENALELIQWVLSNDASKLVDGKVQYACLPNGRGGIVDDLLIYRFSEEEYMLVVNASNIEKDWKWLNEQNSFGAILEDRSDATSLLAVQGPKAVKTMQPLTDIDLSSMKYYTFQKGVFADVDDVIVSATGYTGAGGFELYFPNGHAEEIWNKVLDSGKPHGIKPAGLAARDTLRLEMGFCLYGNDIDDNTSPIEAGLGWVTKFTKDFVDAGKLKNQKENGVERKLAGFKMTERGIPRKGYKIYDEGGNHIGEVTSGTMSPSLKEGIGMGYLKIGYTKPGTRLKVEIRNKRLTAKVVKLPFIKS